MPGAMRSDGQSTAGSTALAPGNSQAPSHPPLGAAGNCYPAPRHARSNGHSGRSHTHTACQLPASCPPADLGEGGPAWKETASLRVGVLPGP